MKVKWNASIQQMNIEYSQKFGGNKYFRQIISLLNNKDRVFYSFGIGELGYHIINSFILTLTAYFLTDVAMLSVTTTGVIESAARLVKIFGAPLCGILIDLNFFKKGKYLPWIKLSTVLMGIGYIIMFYIPTLDLPQTTMAILILIAFVLSTFLNVFFSTSYGAMQYGVTADAKKRALVSSSRSIGREGGEMIGGLVYPLVFSTLILMQIGERKSTFYTCIVLVLLFYLCIYILLRELRIAKVDNYIGTIKQKIKIKNLLIATIKNKALLMASAIMIFYCFRHFLGASVKIYYYTKIIGNFEIYAIDRIVSGVVGMGIVFFVPYLVGKYGTKKTYVSALFLTAICHMIMYPFAHSWVFYIILYGISEATINVVSVLTLNMFAIACDYGEKKLGQDCGGVGMSLYTTSLQISLLGSTILRTFILNSANYVGSTMDITPEASNAIILLLTVLPAIFLIVATIIAYKFPTEFITETEN